MYFLILQKDAYEGLIVNGIIGWSSISLFYSHVCQSRKFLARSYEGLFLVGWAGLWVF